MTDIALRFVDPAFDLLTDGSDIVTDETLETAIMISLFSDARVSKDEIPEWESSARGWWADALSDIPGDTTGSRLWLLSREKQTFDVTLRAREYCEQALAWLVADGVASSVNVECEFVGREILGISVTVTKPSGTERFSFEHLWRDLGA